MKTLKAETDYTLEEKDEAVSLTEIGTSRAERYFKIDNLSDVDNMEILHHINQALRAHKLKHRDKDYIVQDDEIIIVDEFTGRLMHGRRYSEGLHQAIEAKERVTVARESVTMATITFQNYFRLYNKLAGMTGTAKTEEEEFSSIYNMNVITIPTNKPMIRQDMEDIIYKNEKVKFDAVIDEIVARHQTGQLVLVGTISIEKSETLSRLLSKKGIKHNVLMQNNMIKRRKSSPTPDKEAQLPFPPTRQAAERILCWEKGFLNWADCTLSARNATKAGALTISSAVVQAGREMWAVHSFLFPSKMI